MLLSDDTATLEINTLSLHDALPISLQQGTDGRDVGAFESDLGEAVLRDLHGSAGLPHLLAQLLHLGDRDRKSTRLNSSHGSTSYAAFCLKEKIFSDCGRNPHPPCVL